MTNLDHARPLHGTGPIVHRSTTAARPLDLRMLIAKFCMKLGMELDSRGYYLAINVSPALPRFFVGDALLIHDLLNNIIHHALKYLGEGGVSIEIRSTMLSTREHQVIFVFTVSGEEVPDMRAQGIFSCRFERCAAGRHVDPPSLSIAKMITTTLGGDMVISHNGELGTIYIASINLHLPAEPLATCRNH